MKYVEVKNISGWVPNIKCLKKKHFQTLDITPTGDAPKDFVQAYFYRKGEKRVSKKLKYIAKVGHKHYPIESITEYLLNQLGAAFGLKMAESDLGAINYSGRSQIRFFSKYFLNKNEQLVHGADIYAAYLNDDQIINQIEVAKMEKELITVQEAKKALEYLYPQNPELITEYCKLLLFDALVGNNDRHFYNWGCVESVTGEYVKFSPIYDTARGLLWNISDNDLIKWQGNPSLKTAKLEKYVCKSQPKIGWDNEKNLNHFELIKLLYHSELMLNKEGIRTFYNQNALQQSIQFIKSKTFKPLVIKERALLIEECLLLRFQKLNSIFND